MNDEHHASNVIFAYTRTQALADGEQVDISTIAKEARIRFPVFLTRRVYDRYVKIPPNVEAQNETGRLWDIVWMLFVAIKRSRPGLDRIPVILDVRNDNRRARTITLIATCGALDMNDPRPAITVMMPDED